MSDAIRFDPAAPYEVEETDAPFARPDGVERLARIYRPRGQAGAPLAALVDVHGGAWNRGDHTTGVLHGQALAASGLVVVSLDFRQGPDHRHPAASQDVAAGVRWTRAHARRLGVDPRRIGLLGSSSGGHLALLAGLTPGAPEFAGSPALGPDGPLTSGDDSVALVLALYPVADPLARYRYVLGREHEPAPASGFDAKRLLASHRAFFADEAAMAAASVTRLVTAGQARALPPVWLGKAELDDNVPGEVIEAFVAAYQAAGGSIERTHFPGAGHGFIGKAGPDADKALALMREFIGRHLAG
jgi:acetyl esterase/lipase